AVAPDHSLSAIRYPLQSKNILHRIQPGLAANHPLRGANGASGERHPVAGAMCELDAFADAREGDGVIPDHIAPPEDAEANAARLPRAARAMSCVLRLLAQRDAAAPRRRLAERERGSGGRILLVAVVRLEDLDVVRRIECARRL